MTDTKKLIEKVVYLDVSLRRRGLFPFISLYPSAGYILSSELSQPDVTRHSARPARLKYSTRADDT